MTIIEETGNDDAANVQSVTLRNAATGRYIGSVASAPTTSTSGTGFFNGNAGYAVNMAENSGAFTAWVSPTFTATGTRSMTIPRESRHTYVTLCATRSYVTVTL